MDLINQIARVSDEIAALVIQLDKKRIELDGLLKQAYERNAANEKSADEVLTGSVSTIGPDEADDGCNTDRTEEICDANITTPVVNKMCISDIRRVLTLNDKFRFKRELFGNDEQKFAAALQLINTFESEQEADEYIAAEIAKDNNSDVVEEFAAVIKRNLSGKTE